MIIGIDVRNIGKQRTGDETVFLHLVRYLAKIDTENTYKLLIDTRDPDELEYVRKHLQIETSDNFELLAIGNGNKFLWNLCVLPIHLWKNKIDLYHTQYIIPFCIPNRTKILTHIHDISFKAHPELISKKDRFFLDLLIPRSLKRSQAVIAVSEFTKQEIVERYNTQPEKVHVVPNAIGDAFLKTQDQPEPSRESLLEKYSLPDTYALYVGTLQPRKNLPFLIRAFSDLRDKIPNIKLVLTGSKKGHFYDALIDKTIEELGMQDSVIFPGYIDTKDLPFVYRHARIFTFPSLYEGFGIPLLEAMSQNVPVIASDTLINKEIANSGALYFDPKNLDKAKELLYYVLNDEKIRQTLKQAGNEQLVRFSWFHSAQTLLSVYTKLHQDIT